VRTAAGAAALSVTANASSFGGARRLDLSAALPDPGTRDGLPEAWQQRKIRQVRQEMKQRDLNALVLLHATNIIYTTGYFHLSTERPLAAVIPESGDPALFVPGLESDQVKLWWVKDCEAYSDFPGPVNWVRWIFERVAKRGRGGGRIGVEEPTPSRLAQMKLGASQATIVNAGDLIEHMHWVKDGDEIRIMRCGMHCNDFSIDAGRVFIQTHGNATENEIL